MSHTFPCLLHYGGLVKSVVHRYQPERNPFANWILGVARIKSLDYKRKYAQQLRETSWDAIAFAQESNRKVTEAEQ